MASFFPGMDPYLEAPDIWPDLHDALAGEIRGALNRSLPAPYYARLEMRPEIGIVEEPRPRKIIPDVTVVRRPAGTVGASTTAILDQARTELSDGIEVRCFDDAIKHHFVEVRDSTRGHKLITLIEIVSPSNKRPGPDREAYVNKQADVLSSDTSLVAIDLLRSGDRPLPDSLLIGGPLERSDYLVVVNRAWDRGTYILFPFSIRQLLPCIPIPLREKETVVPLDLQFILNRAYESGPYRRGAVDYTEAPDPPLSPQDAEWASRLVARAT